MRERSFQINAKRREGCCFRLAWLGLMRSTEPLVLAHGVLAGPDNTRVFHAWLEGTDFVYDPELDRFFTMDEYVHGFAAEVTKVYTQTEAAALVLMKGHYGPW